MSSAARKRRRQIAIELDALRDACGAAGADCRSASTAYSRRLGDVLAGWHNEMRRRAGLLLGRDGAAAEGVWELVGDIRDDMSDIYGDMAAEIAVSVLEPLQWQKKPLAACRAV